MRSNEREAVPEAPSPAGSPAGKYRDRRRMAAIIPRATATALAVLAIALAVIFAAFARTWIDRRAGEEAKRSLAAAEDAFQGRIACGLSDYLRAKAEIAMDAIERSPSMVGHPAVDSAFARDGGSYAVLDGKGRWILPPKTAAGAADRADFADRVGAIAEGYGEVPVPDPSGDGKRADAVWIARDDRSGLSVVAMADRESLVVSSAPRASETADAGPDKGDGYAFLVDSDRKPVWGTDRFSLARFATPAPRRVKTDGRDFLIDTTPLSGSPWILVSATPLGSYDRLATAFSVAMASALLLAILGAVVVLRTLLARALRPFKDIDEIAEAVSAGDLSPRIGSESDDEIGDFVELFDRVMDDFAALVTNMKAAIGSLGESIQNLSASTQEIASTSNEQAASVKEVLSTMEDSDRLSKGVEVKIGEVAKIANHTKDNVARGFELIQSSLGKMDEIRNTNAETLTGIKTLGDQIETIWDIVNIITGIADQTKIIAFNAELEAAAAGDAGKNFRIVADEIRRLADGTVDSTNEIKTKINEIQRASDKLILASERGTQRIKEGWDVSTRIRGVFEDVLRSSEISASSATDISRSIRMQVVSFDQIFLTLKQISESIDSFVQSTSYTTEVSDLLSSISVSFRDQIAAYTLHRPDPRAADPAEIVVVAEGVDAAGGDGVGIGAL